MQAGFKMNISIIGALEKTVYVCYLDKGKNKIDLSEFNYGLYILKAENNDQTIKERVQSGYIIFS
jgi:hypothetical protein